MTSDQGRVIEAEGGDAISDKSEDISDREGRIGAYRRTSSDVEERLGIK